MANSFLSSNRNATIALAVGTFLLGRYLTVNKRRLLFLIGGLSLVILGKKPEARFAGLLMITSAIYSYFPIRNAYGFVSQAISAFLLAYSSVNYGLPLLDKATAPLRAKLIK